MQKDTACIWSTVPIRAWFAALSLGTLGLVVIGMTLQHLLRLSPCPLCIFQRVLYLVIGILALAGALYPVLRQLWEGMIAALAGGGFLVAAYQTWMQAYPHLAPECSFTDPNLIERFVDWLGMLSPRWFLATGFCSSREWEFLGLSMANWSLLMFAGIIAYVLLLLRYRSAP